MTNLDSMLKSRDITLLTKVHIFKWSCMVVRAGLYKRQSTKNWCFRTVVLEKTPESPLDSKEIKPVNLKGNQPWLLVGRTDAKDEASVLWSPDAKSWLIGKVHEARKFWRQKKRASEDGITNAMDMNMGKLREMVKDREASVLPSMGLQRVRYDWATEQQQQKYTIYYNHATKFEWLYDFYKFGDQCFKNLPTIT